MEIKFLACINFRTLCRLILGTSTTIVRADSYNVYSYMQPTTNLTIMHSLKASDVLPLQDSEILPVLLFERFSSSARFQNLRAKTSI